MNIDLTPIHHALRELENYGNRLWANAHHSTDFDNAKEILRIAERGLTAYNTLREEVEERLTSPLFSHKTLISDGVLVSEIEGKYEKRDDE